MRKLYIAAAVLVVVILVIVVSLLVAKKPAPAPVITQQIQPTGRTLQIPVTLTKQFFNPKTITIRAGDSVALQITAPDTDHAVFIPDLNVHATITKQQVTPVEFTPKKTGSLQMYCSDSCDTGVMLTINVQ